MPSSSTARASEPDEANGGVIPQHYSPPTSRELRAQAMHRLQVGMLGLATMLLLVALANIMMERAQSNEPVAMPTEAGGTVAPATAAPPVPKPATDPLADIGVVPDLPASDTVPPDAGQPTGEATAGQP